MSKGSAVEVLQGILNEAFDIVPGVQSDTEAESH